MSKKMFKRSLALGALMAFVITGNVWAADITNQDEADTQINETSTNVVVDGAITAKGSNIEIEGNKDATVLTVKVGNAVGYDNYTTGIGGDFRDTDYDTVSISNIKQLNINGDGVFVDEPQDFGVSAGSDSGDKNKPNGKVYIDNMVGKVCITGVDIGVFAGGNKGLVQIESQELSIEGYIGVLSNAGSTINLGTEENKLKSLFVKTNENYGIRASGSSNINIFADTVTIEAMSYGIRPDNGNIDINAKSISIVSENADAIAVWASNGHLDICGTEVSLHTNKQGGNAIYGYANAPVTIVGKEKLDIKGNIHLKRTNSVVNINDDCNDALVTIEGDIINELDHTNSNYGAGSAKITLGAEGSYLKGKVKDTNVDGSITLTMNKGTMWDVTGNSTIGKVVGTEATVRVNSAEENYVVVADGNDAKNFAFLGSKEVTDQLDSANPEASMEKVEKIVNGIKFASYNFEEGSSLGEIIAYQEDGVWKFNERTNVTNTNISDVAALGLMAWRSEMNDMNKRLGELRNANGEHGVWVRMVRGESEYEAVKNQYNTYQLGYDEKLSVDKSWTVGMALSYTDAESSFKGGNGENKHKGFAIYGSKLNDDGSFIDLIAKYARMEHDVEVGTEKGDYDTNGYSVSAEYGKRFEQGNGLWIEPQVELTYGQVGSADYMIGKNRAVTHEGMESLVGRVGFSLGKDISKGNIYARASYLYDFDGETEASYTDAVGNRRYINDDLGGGWFEVGVGANINLSKATYIYADIEKTFGGEVDTNWQWNLGVRYSF